jgi:hypothetical protein
MLSYFWEILVISAGTIRSYIKCMHHLLIYDMFIKSNKTQTSEQ